MKPGLAWCNFCILLVSTSYQLSFNLGGDKGRVLVLGGGVLLFGEMNYYSIIYPKKLRFRLWG